MKLGPLTQAARVVAPSVAHNVGGSAVRRRLNQWRDGDASLDHDIGDSWLDSIHAHE